MPRIDWEGTTQPTKSLPFSRANCSTPSDVHASSLLNEAIDSHVFEACSMCQLSPGTGARRPSLTLNGPAVWLLPPSIMGGNYLSRIPLDIEIQPRPPRQQADLGRCGPKDMKPRKASPTLSPEPSGASPSRLAEGLPSRLLRPPELGVSKSQPPDLTFIKRVAHTPRHHCRLKHSSALISSIVKRFHAIDHQPR